MNRKSSSLTSGCRIPGKHPSFLQTLLAPAPAPVDVYGYTYYQVLGSPGIPVTLLKVLDREEV